MLIDSPEMLKAWLAHVLGPLCDADPAALAKYVLALVKKDKEESELRQSMVEQLEVFLQNETKHFVGILFEALESKSYLLFKDKEGEAPPLPPNQPPPPPPPPPQPSSPANTVPIISVTNAQVSTAVSNGAAIVGPEPVVKKDLVDVKRKAESDKEDENHIPHKSRSPLARRRTRSHSRSRSWDRLRRSRSRERLVKGRKVWEERWRKSPPPLRRFRRSWSHSRSRSPPSRGRSPLSRGRSPPPRRLSRRTWSRSPVPRSPRPPRSRSPISVSVKPFIRSRSRSKSNEKRDSKSGSVTPTQDSNHGDVDMRLSTTSQSIRSVVNTSSITVTVPSESPVTGSFPPESKQRCRDYDEKGFCMRGDMCAFDHGVDPVVVDNYQLLELPSPPPPPPPPSSGGGNNYMSGGVHKQHLPPLSMEPYNPDAPSMGPRLPWRPHFRGQQPGRGGPMIRPNNSTRLPLPGCPNMFQQQQRELINVPLASAGQQPHMPPHIQPHMVRPPYNQPPHHFNKRRVIEVIYEPPMKKRTFDYNRLGPRNKPLHCSLELRKVPSGLNNITLLNTHFEKFGKINNIQVSYEGDSEGALITFSNHAEANAAYRCTEAVLNNRFIKVFWHNKENNNQQEDGVEMVHSTTVYTSPALKLSVKDRLTLPPPPPKVTVEIPVVTEKEERKVVERVVVVPSAKEALKKKQLELRKDAVKISVDLNRRKQDIIKEQLGQQKRLLERINECTKPEEKKKLMKILKSVQVRTEVIHKDLSAKRKAATTSADKEKIHKPVTKEEAEREILDAEMDLYNRQQEGGDTFEIIKKVAELKIKYRRMGLYMSDTRGRGRGGRGGRGRGRGRGRVMFAGGFGSASTILDRRPSKILVSGFEVDEERELLKHFAKFGTVVDQVLEKHTPSLVLNYKTRKEAEVALIKGKNFNDRSLQIVWYADPSLNLATHGIITDSSGRIRKLSVASGREEEEEDINDDESSFGYLNEDELLLQDDEEEDEDGEGRSWRR